MTHEIWSTTDKMFSHFRPFFTLLLLPSPLPPSTPINNPKNQNFKKRKQHPRDIIIFHKCTVNDNHMICSSWDINCNRQFFLSSWTICYHFTPLTAQKTEKNLLEISSFYTSVSKIMITGYTGIDSRDMARDGCNCYVSFWAIFCPFTSLTAQKMKI